AAPLLGREELIRALGRSPKAGLHALARPVEGVPARAVVWGPGGTAVFADIAAVVGRENHRLGYRDRAFADLLAVYIECHLPAFAEAATGIGKLHAHLVLARRQCPCGFNVEVMHPRHVVAVFKLAVLRVEAPAA